jgi:hypothetical protein
MSAGIITDTVISIGKIKVAAAGGAKPAPAMEQVTGRLTI